MHTMNRWFGLALASLVTFGTLATARAAPVPLDGTQWAKVFGTSAAGWNPTVIGALRDGMTPAEAAKVMPGADKVSKHGFAKLTVNDAPGVLNMELYFRKAKDGGDRTLGSVKLVLDPRVEKDEAVYAALIQVLEAKYGKVKKADSIAEKKVTWVAKGGRSAQLWKIGRELTFKVGL